jgi:hypothetical protein
MRSLSALEQADIRAAFEMVEKEREGFKDSDNEDFARKLSAPVGRLVVSPTDYEMETETARGKGRTTETKPE